MRPPRTAHVTIGLIALSVIASLPLLGGNLGAGYSWLLIDEPGYPPFASILGGEVWRLATPMFLHFGTLHLLFNMMWMWDLARPLEMRKGPAFLAAFVAAVGVASNLLQYAITGSPLFGGMSGVVYGLLGYVWIQGRVNPHFGIGLHQSTVIMMLAWFVLCWTGILGPIANWAHTGGLLAGVAWGYASGRTRA